MITNIDNWLPLAEYSIKYQVSISTLRRKIKVNDIKFRFDDGKYFIYDEMLKKNINAEEHRPSQVSEVQKNSAQILENKELIAFKNQTQVETDKSESIEKYKESLISSLQNSDMNGSVISAANRLLADLKKAYTQILQEKEEQILQLREETMDLKTLIKVLEAENTRLRG